MNVMIETYGCTMNQADSDIMRGILSKSYNIVSSENEADIVVINTCGVIGYTERKILKRISELKKKNKKVIASGCLARISKNSLKNLADAILSPDNVNLIDKVVDEVLSGKKVELIRINRIDKAELHNIKCRRNENAIAIVSISEGCLGRCSYCATKIARGRLRSFSIQKIVEEVKRVVDAGFKEIQLTSQDTSAYGIDRDYRLPDLLNKISEINGDFRVRVGMMNPQHAIEILDDLISAFRSEKIYKFIHIPVQSGDNKILEDMKRDHTVEDFEEIVRCFRRNFEDVTISTDIIVGFPTESEESFERSYELIKRVKPDIVNITRYSPRKGTLAYKLKDLPDWIKKERSRKLTELCKKIGMENNKKFINTRMKVLVTKKGKKDTFLARTNSYRPVIIDKGRIGEFLNVKIVKAEFNYLKGVRSFD